VTLRDSLQSIRDSACSDEVDVPIRLTDCLMKGRHPADAKKGRDDEDDDVNDRQGASAHVGEEIDVHEANSWGERIRITSPRVRALDARTLKACARSSNLTNCLARF
jgi:hypothetical protein